ncbi:unnamed protein product [Closterium sp. NIES-65]|nr:unnamed protein product [Closterium sp. NIES-65]
MDSSSDVTIQKSPSAVTRPRGIDYSKWDHVISSSDEDEGEPTGKRDGGGSGGAVENAKKSVGVIKVRDGCSAGGSSSILGKYGEIWKSREEAVKRWKFLAQAAVGAGKAKVPMRQGGKGRVEGTELHGKLQLLSRANMLHYLDVKGGWGARDVWGGEEELRERPEVQFCCKCELAPLLCVEAMMTDWLSEPRVGVLMDLGKIRSRLPAILAATGTDAAAGVPATRIESWDLAYPAVLMELGARRQAENDCVASMLVQVLGVKESADLQEGFGFFVQHLLSGGLEKVHAEEKRRGGAVGAVGGRGAADNFEGEMEEKDEKWRENLKGREWESGMGATDFALALATVISRPPYCKVAPMFLQEGNNPSKIGVEDAAIEEARKRAGRLGLTGRVSEGGRGTGGGGEEAVLATADAWPAAAPYPASSRDCLLDNNVTSLTRGAASHTAASDVTGVPVTSSGLVPVNTNAAIAVLTYRVACILRWVRVYGSDFISAKDCFKDSPQGKVRPMRHPLRDLPSLLLRFGNIPGPLAGQTFPMEWEEWPQGDEAAVKFPDDSRAECVGLGILEESGMEDETRRRSSGQSLKAGGKRRDRRNRGNVGGRGGIKDPRTPNPSPPSITNHCRPIVRCMDDVDYILDFAAGLAVPPACTECNRCAKHYTSLISFVAFVANFAYRPASFLLNCFLSVFQSHSKDSRAPAASADTCGTGADFSAHQYCYALARDNAGPRRV